MKNQSLTVAVGLSVSVPLLDKRAVSWYNRSPIWENDSGIIPAAQGKASYEYSDRRLR
jgi:hypothetical protein